MSNMDLWDKLKRTDPNATKPFTRAGGFRGNQIDPVWRIQRMTQVFGPIGQGWGWEQVDWTVAERMVFICARVWYLHPESGEKCFTGPQWGGTELVRRRRDGNESPDDEAFKMSMTDAVGKCLLQIGLAADVHMGLFDDSKYQRENEQYWREQRQQEVAATNGAAEQPPKAQPHVIAVHPLPDGSGSDWKRYGEELRAAIWASATVDEVNAWMEKNDTPLRNLEKASATAAKFIREYAEKRRGVLSQAPADEAA